MRRYTRWFFSIIIIYVMGMTVVHAAPRTAELVMDARTGDILHEKHGSKIRHPASLTKIMTLYLLFDALEKGDLSPTTRLYVSRHAAGQPPSKLGLKTGSTITVQDAIYALSVKSANDVAATVAEALGGSESQFARMMTARAARMGMTDTVFFNASGLPNKNQVTTARDMAKLSIYLMNRFPQYYSLFSKQKFQFGKMTLTSHNRLLKQYQGADGIKTGYIAASGFNLVASAQRNGRRLIGVIFGGRSAAARDKRMKAILDQGFANRNHQRKHANLGMRVYNIAALKRQYPVFAQSHISDKARKSALLKIAAIKPQGRPFLLSESAFALQNTLSSLPKVDRTPNPTIATATANSLFPLTRSSEESKGTASIIPQPAPAKKTDSVTTLLASLDTSQPEPAKAVPHKSVRLKQENQMLIAHFSPEPKKPLQGWGVQVGAFTKNKEAHKYAQTLRNNYRELFPENLVIQKTQLKAGILYRIRFPSNSANRAQNICKKLEADRRNCLVIRMS